MFGLTADLISLVYLGFAAYTLRQLAGRWRALLDATYTQDDRGLASRAGLLLLTPLGVLIHELAHLLAAWAFGARETALSFRIYWGYVQYTPRLGPVPEFAVAAAGPAASLALGLAALFIGMRARAAVRDAGLAFAHATLLLVLILYPAMSFVEGEGDFLDIYSAATPTLSLAAGLVHALGLGVYLLAVRRLSAQTRAEARAAWSERFDGHLVAMPPEHEARLRELEGQEAERRLLPADRDELEQLREIRGWVAEHNQQVLSRNRLPGSPVDGVSDPNRADGPSPDAPPVPRDG